MKLSKGEIFTTPVIGKLQFSCNKALRKVAPKPCAIMKVLRSLSQQFLRRV